MAGRSVRSGAAPAARSRSWPTRPRARSRKRREAEDPHRTLVRTTARVRPRENSVGRPAGETRGKGCAIAAREGGGRAACPLSNEGVPDWGKLCRFHGGMAEAVLAAHFGIDPRATAKEARTGIRGGLRQGRQRLDRKARGFRKNTPPRSQRGPPKRCGRREALSSPVSTGGIPPSTRPTKSR